MNFIDKAKATASQVNAKKEGVMANNPFLKKTGDAPKTPGFSKPNVPGAKPPVPGKKPPMPGAKPPMPGNKPNIPAPQTTKVEEKKEEVIAPVAEEKVEIPVVEKVEEPVAVEEKAETPKEEAKPAAKKSRRKGGNKKTTTPEANAKEEKIVQNNESAPVEVATIPTTEVNYTEAVASIKSSFVDEEWEAFRDEITAQLGEIVISNDMNSVSLKATIAKLSGLREDIWLKFIDTKTMFDTLASEKPEGLIERVKKANLVGSNENERKRNAVMAVMNYKSPDGTVVNLYEVLDETRARFNFLDGVMRSIQYKTDVLVTMLGSLKLERTQGGLS